MGKVSLYHHLYIKNWDHMWVIELSVKIVSLQWTTIAVHSKCLLNNLLRGIHAIIWNRQVNYHTWINLTFYLIVCMRLLTKYVHFQFSSEQPKIYLTEISDSNTWHFSRWIRCCSSVFLIGSTFWIFSSWADQVYANLSGLE